MFYSLFSVSPIRPDDEHYRGPYVVGSYPSNSYLSQSSEQLPG